MNRYHLRTLAATLAALSMPAVVALMAVPTAVAATVLAAEGTTRPSGEAQTAFNRALCEQNTCRSLGFGPLSTTTSGRQIQTGVNTTPGDIILVGYSLGASGVYNRLREWEKDPSQAPAPERVLLIVTYGNPENKFGGNKRNSAGAGLPAKQPYQHLDVVAQYDSVADRPARLGFYSAINGLTSRHFTYFDDLDVNDPGNLVYQEGSTTYMLIPADTLPMLRWVAPFVSLERLAELDAKYRPLVELDYDRPDFIEQGEGADWGNGSPPPTVQDLMDHGLAERRSDATADADERTALAPDIESLATATRKRGYADAGDVDDETDVQQSASDEVAAADRDGDADDIAADNDGDDIAADNDVDADSSDGSGTDSDTDRDSVDSADAA